MACKSILEYMIDYFDGNLDSEKRQLVEEHLLNCSSCKKEYDEHETTVKAIRKANQNERQGIVASSDFELWMHEALKDENRTTEGRAPNNRRVRKAGMVAAVIAVCITLTIFTPVYAALRDGITDLIDYALGDRGIVNSIEKGFGQVVEKSSSDNDVVLTAHNFISDKNRSVILFSTKYNGILEETADNLSLYGMSVTDKSGNSISNSFSSSYKYNSELQEVTGNIDLGGINSDTRDIVVKLDLIVLSQQKKLKVPLKFTGKSMSNLNLEINLDTPTIKKVVFNNIIVNDNIMTIDYNIVYTDPKYSVGGEYLNLLYSDELGWPYTHGSRTGEDKNTAYIQEQYSLEGIDLLNASLEFSYAKPIKVIDGDWKVRFKPDRNIAKNSTKTFDIDRDFTISDYTMKVTKIDFSPSMTGVHIEGKGVSPLSVLGLTHLKTKNGDVYSTISGVNNTELSTNSDKVYSALLSFDPIYETENIALVIQSAIFPKAINGKMLIEPGVSSLEEIMKLDEEKFKVIYKEVSQGTMEVSFENLDPRSYTEITANGIYAVDSKGNKLSPIRDSMDSKQISISHFGTFRFEGVEPGDITLHIESVTKYQEIYQEVGILD